MFEKGLLAGKRILVTGGGSGLGAAMGRRFVELGAELIICGRRLELLEATAAQMRSEFGGKVTVARCDIRDGAAVDAMMDQRLAAKRRSTCWSTMLPQPSSRRPNICRSARRTRSWRPTLHGTMYCTLAAGKRWIEGKHKGVVLSILSTSTITGRAFTVPSAMAKTAGAGDDQKPCGGVGTEGRSYRRDRAGRVSDPGRLGSASPRGPR